MNSMRPGDASARLAVFGALAILVGAVSALLGVAQFLLPVLLARGPLVEAAAFDVRTASSALVLHVLLGAAFVWAGIGSIRRRRWVPSVMRTLAWTWLVGGALAVGLVGLVVGELPLVAPDGGAPDPDLLAAVRAVLVALLALGGVALPAAFLWAYRDPRVRATCERDDPQPGWSDRCPAPVLGLALGLGAAAALGLPLAMRPALPCFGFVVTGWPGVAGILGLSAVSAWLARSVYRQERWGYRLTLAFVLLTAASMGVTLVAVDPIDAVRALGPPESQIEWLARSAPLVRLASGVAVLVATALSVAYLLAIRRHFGGRHS